MSEPFLVETCLGGSTPPPGLGLFWRSNLADQSKPIAPLVARRYRGRWRTNLNRPIGPESWVTVSRHTQKAIQPS